MMIVKLKVKAIAALMLLIALAVQGCAPSQVEETNVPLATSTVGEVPTWTPRPVDLTQTALPTATRPFDQTPSPDRQDGQDKPAPVSSATTVPPPTLTVTSAVVATPKIVRVTIEGGNLFVRRGPSLDYNSIGVLYDGVTVLATGRDRVSRWIRIALPSDPLVEGWITTGTSYTLIDGDIPNLPYIETEPARPAYIRNCTTHELWVAPAEVKLLEKFEAPDNEERFPVGIYQVYDLENPDNKPIIEVNLSEGKRVDIQYDWTGEKSKCE